MCWLALSHYLVFVSRNLVVLETTITNQCYDDLLPLEANQSAMTIRKTHQEEAQTQKK